MAKKMLDILSERSYKKRIEANEAENKLRKALTDTRTAYAKDLAIQLKRLDIKHYGATNNDDGNFHRAMNFVFDSKDI